MREGGHFNFDALYEAAAEPATSRALMRATMQDMSDDLQDVTGTINEMQDELRDVKERINEGAISSRRANWVIISLTALSIVVGIVSLLHSFQLI